MCNYPGFENNTGIFKQGSPGSFACAVSGGRWTYAPHLRFIDQVLLKLCRREITRLIINMPPRHGKSELISKYFPAWYLGNFPSHRIILSSYEARFAESWGRRVRDLMKESGNEYFGTAPDPKVSAASSFVLLNSGGGMDCAGTGGAITGKGADLLIIDDPVKNSSEASSAIIRNNAWEWFLSTAYTRLEPEGLLVIIMTRWHEDDLCGRILNSNSNIFLKPAAFPNGALKEEVSEIIKKQGVDEYPAEECEKWWWIDLPAFAGEHDQMGREPQMPLWPERFSEKKLKRIQKTLGSYLFSALYQQKPYPAEGGIFKRKHFRYYSEDDEFYYLSGDQNKYTCLKESCMIIASLDLAVTSRQTSDYTAAVIAAVTPKKDILIIDVIRERFDGADHLKLIDMIFRRWKPAQLGIECTQYQTSLLQTALNAGYPVVGLKADKDKTSRALSIAARLEGGAVYFRADAHYLPAFEDELLSFPNGTHDDQADAFAYLAVMIHPLGSARPAGADCTDRRGRKSIAGGFGG